MPEIPNIDAIVELILTEARKGSRWDNYTNLLTLWQKLSDRILPILTDLKKDFQDRMDKEIKKGYFSLPHKKAEERRLRGDEDKE